MIGTRGGTQPADLSDVRTTNLAVVLRYVRTHAPCSRADIAASTGLNKATVSSLVSDLLDRRLLLETGMAENRIGRPAAMLTLQSAPYAAIGLEVAADHLTAVAVDLTGERLLSWRRAYAGLGAGRAEAAIAALAGRVVAKMTGQDRQVLGVTVGVPGLVTATGGVRFAPHLGWPDLDLGAALARALHHPSYDVVVETDANLAALAEFRNGAWADTPDLVTLLGGAGVGAGIVADGRLLRGSRGLAGQIAHLPVDADGPLCRCGRRGCLQEVTGLPALVRRALPDTEADGTIVDYTPEIERMVALAGAGDATVTRALAEAGGHLGQAVSVLVDLLDPQVVVLGGSFAALGPWLLPAVEAEVKSRAVAPGESGCRIVVSTLHPDATALGGAALTLDRLEAGQLPPAG